MRTIGQTEGQRAERGPDGRERFSRPEAREPSTCTAHRNGRPDDCSGTLPSGLPCAEYLQARRASLLAELDAIRVKLGATKTDLGRHMRVTSQAVGQALTPGERTTIATVQKITSALGHTAEITIRDEYGTPVVVVPLT